MGIALLLLAVIAGVGLQSNEPSGDFAEPPSDADLPTNDAPTGGEARDTASLVGTISRVSMEHSYTLMFLATLTGILSRRGTPGLVRLRAQRVHTLLAYGAGALVALHVLTQLDSLSLIADVLSQVVTGGLAGVDTRGLSKAVGVGIGLCAVVVTTVAAVSFLRPRLFTGSVRPYVVHAFVYAGFATIHALVLGHESTQYVTFTAVVLGTLGLQYAWSRYQSNRRKKGQMVSN